ncbi:hypothetical protein BRADI_1g42462v3, partial [Brachypodium distachyon]
PPAYFHSHTFLPLLLPLFSPASPPSPPPSAAAGPPPASPIAACLALDRVMVCAGGPALELLEHGDEDVDEYWIPKFPSSRLSLVLARSPVPTPSPWPGCSHISID